MSSTLGDSWTFLKIHWPVRCESEHQVAFKQWPYPTWHTQHSQDRNWGPGKSLMFFIGLYRKTCLSSFQKLSRQVTSQENGKDLCYVNSILFSDITEFSCFATSIPGEADQRICFRTQNVWCIRLEELWDGVVWSTDIIRYSDFDDSDKY